jgi:tetratricopeptide (TPR) repeat protein
MKILDKFFSKDDPNKELNSILERGKSLLEKNFYEWAAVEFNKALELDPKLATETVTKLFQEMQSGGNPDGIISLGVNVLKTDPKNIELANLLGNTYRKKHDWNRAKNMYNLCLKHDPDFKNASYNLAAANAKMEIADANAVSAIGEFEKLTDFVLPDIQEGLLNLVEMQQHFTIDKGEVNDLQTADVKKENEFEEESKESTENKKELNEVKEDAKKSAAKNVEEEAKTGEAAKNKADEEEIQAERNSIDSEQTWNYIISNLEAESEEENKACFALGIYCLQTMDGIIAKNVFKRLLMREKENVDLRCFLVLASSIEGDIDNAIKTFQSILIRNPNHRYSNVNLGILYKRKGMILQSRVNFFTTFKLLERSQSNYNIDVCLQDADNHFEGNRTKKALEIYETLVPEITSQELLLRIAKLNVDNKSWDEAFEIYRRVLRINRQNKEAREGIKSVHTAYLVAAENYLKKKDPKNAVVLIDKALSIAVSKNLLHKAINLNNLLKNENRAIQLEEMLKSYTNKEGQVEVQSKISKAEEAEKNGKYKSAIRYYEEAIKLDPQNSTLKKLVDLCVHIKRPDLAEKVSNWFVKYQYSHHEKEKAQARDTFEQIKKKEEVSQQDEN